MRYHLSTTTSCGSLPHQPQHLVVLTESHVSELPCGTTPAPYPDPYRPASWSGESTWRCARLGGSRYPGIGSNRAPRCERRRLPQFTAGAVSMSVHNTYRRSGSMPRRGPGRITVIGAGTPPPLPLRPLAMEILHRWEANRRPSARRSGSHERVAMAKRRGDRDRG
jgi:hypothetical protein